MLEPVPIRRTMLLAAVLALASGAGLTLWRWNLGLQDWQSAYLVAWLYWCGLSLGSLSLLLLHNLTGGAWGWAIRGSLRALAAMLPALLLLFLPLLWQLPRLYPWATSAVEHDLVLQHKAVYLNESFFAIRFTLYAALWLGTLWLLHWQERVENPSEERRARLRMFSGQALGLHGLAMTFAAIDWSMSLEPHWFSAIYGVISFVFDGLGAYALALLLSVLINRSQTAATSAERMSAVSVETRHDLGKLLLAFVMLWAYVSFSQFFIIWYGNLPEETVWYLKRLEHGWQHWAGVLVLGQFIVPFLCLLGRNFKRRGSTLAAIAGLLIVTRFVDLTWRVGAAFEEPQSYDPWLALGLTLIFGSVWLVGMGLLLPKHWQKAKTLEVAYG
jgi:hypothetical protein